MFGTTLAGGGYAPGTAEIDTGGIGGNGKVPNGVWKPNGPAFPETLCCW